VIGSFRIIAYPAWSPMNAVRRPNSSGLFLFNENVVISQGILCITEKIAGYPRKMVNSNSQTSQKASDRLQTSLPIILMLFLFLIIILRRAWLSDDAYITFRTVDNLVNGYRLTWNTAERVQAYTHPLWMFLVSFFYAFTGEIFITVVVISVVISLAAVALYSGKLARSTNAAVVGVLILGLSNAYVDYSTSGLENPLNHIILVVFYILFFRARLTIRNLFLLSLLASLGMVNRLDTALLYLPPLVYMVWKSQRWSAVLAVVLGQFPIILWELFSIIYYGFPFPNTAYAKLNLSVSDSELWRQGFFYLQDSLERDPIALVAILVSLIVVILSKSPPRLTVLVGVLLYILYAVKIGGDFMSGRFLAAPLLCAVIALTDVPFSRIGSRTMLVIFAALTIIGFRAPIPTIFLEGGERAIKINEHGIADERLYYFEKMSLVNYKVVDGVPVLSDVESGLRAREESKKDYYILPKSNVGVSGYYAGPNVHYIDMFALTDPLLARLPPVRNLDWRIGHFHRIIPQGYVESIYNNESLLKDTGLAEYYEYLRLITRGDFFDPARWEKIWKMNTGQYNHLIDYERYYLPESLTLTKNQAENLEKAVSFEDDGVLVDLGEIQHAGQIQINLGNRDGFRLSFRRDGEEVASIETPRDKASEEIVQMLMDVPPAAVEAGYDSIRVLPSAGDDPYWMSSLVLID